MKLTHALLSFAVAALATGCGNSTPYNANEAAESGDDYLARQVVGVRLLTSDYRYERICSFVEEGFVEETFDLKPATEMNVTESMSGCRYDWEGGQIIVSFVNPNPYPSTYKAEYEFDKMYQPRTLDSMRTNSEKPVLFGPAPQGTGSSVPAIATDRPKTLLPAGTDPATSNGTASGPVDSSGNASGNGTTSGNGNGSGNGMASGNGTTSGNGTASSDGMANGNGTANGNATASGNATADSRATANGNATANNGGMGNNTDETTTKLTRPAYSATKGVAVSGLGDKALWDAKTGMLHVLFLNHIVNLTVKTKQPDGKKQQQAVMMMQVIMDKLAKADR